MNPYEVLVRPVLSEKSNKARENVNQYTFIVRPNANKKDVARAVEKMFDVKVDNVQTMVTRGKIRRKGNAVSKDSNKKKAVVTLVEGAKIALFEDL